MKNGQQRGRREPTQRVMTKECKEVSADMAVTRSGQGEVSHDVLGRRRVLLRHLQPVAIPNSLTVQVFILICYTNYV